jgi:tripartite-type tricarboxylate transporter receptor subunit TctC
MNTSSMSLTLRLSTRLCTRLSFLALALVSSLAATAQTSNDKAMRIVVPFSAGGPTDVIARMIAPRLSDAFKQTVVVDNRVGATGGIGAELVKSAPDGQTILLGTSSMMAANPNLTVNLRYDPIKDFVPVSMVATIDNILVVHPSVPVNSVKDLIAYAKANPNKLSYASSGIGSTYHLGAELFSAQTGIEWVHVPYKGAAPAAQDLIAGHVQVMFDAYSSAVPNMKAGRVKALGIASLKRDPDLPTLPTIAEAGVPGYETVIWLAFFLAKGTPAPLADRLRAELVKIMQSADIKERFATLGMQPVTSTPQALATVLKDDLAKWGKVVRDAGIKPE